MALDYLTLSSLRKNHPAWRLLQADHAPLIASFLQQAFVEPNLRVITQADLASKLEDTLFLLRETEGEQRFPKRAEQYLSDWAESDKGWLRKFYPVDSDEPHYDLTPATEKAINWLESLTQRQFVGTESRLMTVFQLLKQMIEGSETDPARRIAELESRKQVIEAEIERIQAGELELLDETALRDRFQQLTTTARELLSDFREVEQNFRALDQQVRERITLWEGNKGALLEQIFGERDLIADSDQGKSFRAFWDFLMSPTRQEELSALLDEVLQLEPIQQLRPDRRLQRIHYDWLEAGEQAQRTVARLSQQLRRYLDDQTYLENRRIMVLLKQIEGKAIALRNQPPKGNLTEIDESAPNLSLPMERPLYAPPLKPQLEGAVIAGEESVLNTDALFEQSYIDSEQLRSRLRKALQTQPQITLQALLQQDPLEQGLSELVCWLSIASDNPKHLFDETHLDTLQWQDEADHIRQVELPRVIYSR